MIETLKNSKAHLSELVQRAAEGDEVVITVHGRPRARLCPVRAAGEGSKREWGRELKALRSRWSCGARDTGVEMLDELRGDRT